MITSNTPIVAQGEQQDQQHERLSGLAKFGLGISAVGGAGFIPVKDQRVWDYYLRGIKAIETASPGAILRTFRISELLSPLKTWKEEHVNPLELRNAHSYKEFLFSQFGKANEITARRTGAIFGDIYNGEKLVGAGITIDAGTQQGTAIADYYARITGTSLSKYQSLNEDLLRAQHLASKVDVSFEDWIQSLPPSERRRSLILGSPLREKITFFSHDFMLSEKAQRLVARAETAFNLSRAKAAADMGRLNTLLSKPLEIPLIGDLLHKLPGLDKLSTDPGPVSKMAGSFIKKAAIIGAGFKGLEYYDYLRANNQGAALVAGTLGGMALGGLVFPGKGKHFNKTTALVGGAIGLYTSLAPRFDKGLFYGAASVGTDANILRSEVSDTIGMSESLKEQEDVTPGLVSLPTALAFTGTGALFGGVSSYLGFLKDLGINKYKTKEPIARIAEEIRETRATSFVNKLSSLPGGKYLSKIKSPTALGAAIGLASWGILSSSLSLLSGNPMAAIPGANLLGTEETPEDLKAIYSGQEEVPIRKGRWWEFGRCLGARCIIPLYDNKVVAAEEIKIDDVLIGTNYSPTKVVNIFIRKHSGSIYKFSSAYNRNIKTEVTADHKIPILRKKYPNPIQLLEVSASEISVGDFVEIPIKPLESIEKDILTVDFLSDSYFYDNEKNRIYSSQLNWMTKKPQRSGRHSLPKNIPLNNDIGFLFGVFLAEGNLTMNKGIPHFIEMVHAVSELWIVDRIKEITKKYFDTETTVRLKTTGAKTKAGCYITRICSSILAKLFKNLFYYKGYDSLEKQVPKISFTATKEFKEGLIDGYYAGDGHYDNGRVISSSRLWLLEEIQSIAFSVNQICSISIKEENGFLGRWRLRFTQENSTNPSVLIYDNKFYSCIKSIEIENYDDLVYDFEVDAEDHLFQAGTFLVHNSTKYSGGKIDYYRQHFLARLGDRSSQKGMYGSEEERWEHDPLLNPFDAIFGSDEWKYNYELKNQYSRPQPLSSTYGENIPFIGPLVAETFGKLLKPRKLIRADEWKLGEGEFVHRPDIRGESEPAYELGGLAPGAPVIPGESTQLFNEINYRRREAIGLVGFAESSIQKAVTGREELFQNLQTIGTMGEETGSEYWLWKHLNLGGALGGSEAIRRFIPHDRSYLDTYNPLSNNLSSWMPSDYFLDLKYGNPMDKIPEAEIRLPGPGYAARFPELQGVNPEEYPLAHKLKILGDIAMYSPEYKELAKQARINMSKMSLEDQALVKQTFDQIEQKQIRREFSNYRFSNDTLKSQTVTVTNVIDPRTIQTEEFGNALISLKGVGAIANQEQAYNFARENLLGKQLDLRIPAADVNAFRDSGNFPKVNAVAMFGNSDYGTVLAEQGLAELAPLKDDFSALRYSANEKFAGMISENILHGVETPIEYLTPFSPVSKLIRQRSPIEEYIASEAVGTQNAFWDKPIENFLKPTANMMLNSVGGGIIPGDVQERREIIEYFDMLKWAKTKKIQSEALEEGNYNLYRQQKEIEKQTLFGADVFGSPVNAMAALPRRERDFFGEFSEASSEEERSQILNLVPENEKRLYIAQWVRQEAEAAKAKKLANLGTKEDDEIINAAQMLRASEGFETSPDLEQQYMSETDGTIPYDDWMRQKKAEDYFSTHSLPDPSWLGWHPSVDLEDVKLKYVQMAGKDHFDFDLWSSRLRSLARKPYINSELIDQMESGAENIENITKMKSNIKTLTRQYKNSNPKVTSYITNSNTRNRYNIEIVDKRQGLVNEAYKTLGA